MGCKTYLFHLLLFAKVFSSPVCNVADDCQCIPGSDLEVQCPPMLEYNSNKEHVIIHFKERKRAINIDCRSSKRFRMDLLPNIIAGDKTVLIIDSCPLPERNFKQIADHFLMKAVETLHLRNYTNVTLNRDYFEGLQLEELKVTDSNYLYIEEDTFDNIPNLRSLELAKNKNLVINARAFRNLTRLKILYLMQNQLDDVPEGLFQNLKNLKSLHLFNNRLKVITDETFSGLSNLVMLELRTNRIENVSENAFRNLKNLSAVNLSDNRIRTISPNIFKNNGNLTEIRMMHNRELQLPDYLFANLGSLKIVDLSQCDLSSIPEHIFENSTNLNETNLERNKLVTISPRLFQGLRNLENLNLKDNLISEIDDLVFQELGGLKIINLEKNRIVKIHHRAFYGTRNLIDINLSQNQLLKNEKRVDILAQLEHVQELDLSHNLITDIRDVVQTSFHSKLKVLNLSHNRLTVIKLAEVPFSYDVEVNLDRNNITKVDFEDIEDNSRGQGRIKFSLRDNPIDCNCDNYDLFRFLKNEIHQNTSENFIIDSDDVVCQAPKKAKGSKLVKLRPDDITCGIKNTSACPLSCSCSWRPFDTSVVVNCSQRHLTEFPAINHKELMSLFTFNQTEVHLQGNALEAGPSENVTGYDNITRLFLSNNNIKKMEWLPPNLKELHLDNNNLTSLSYNVLDGLNDTVLTLHNNHWTCDCDSLTFTKFLRQHSSQVDVSQVKCHHNQRLLHSLSETDLCFANLLFYILLPVLSFVLFVMFLMFLFYRHQEPIKIWLFAHGYLLWWVTEEELDKDKEYDAFISYSHKDEDFIIQNLLPVLEGGPNPYKLCLHYRHFIPGEMISTQVTKSVLKSRRTLVVLSPNFLESVWGKMEFRTAHTQAMAEGRARVIIVLYGEVDMDMLDDELKAYLKTNTYVKWGDPYFWNKLKYALPHSKRKTLKNQQKITNVMNCIDDKFNLVVPVTPNPGTTPPVLSLSQSVLKKSPLDFVLRQGISTPPAEGVTV